MSEEILVNGNKLKTLRLEYESLSNTSISSPIVAGRYLVLKELFEKIILVSKEEEN